MMVLGISFKICKNKININADDGGNYVGLLSVFYPETQNKGTDIFIITLEKFSPSSKG